MLQPPQFTGSLEVSTHTGFPAQSWMPGVPSQPQPREKQFPYPHATPPTQVLFEPLQDPLTHGPSGPQYPPRHGAREIAQTGYAARENFRGRDHELR